MAYSDAPKPRILFTKCYTDATHTAYADIDGAERMTVGQRTFTPGRILANYHWRTQLGHDGWKFGNIEISGLWVGIDPGSGRVILSMRDAPAWAREFAEANMPTSALVFPARKS